MLPSDWAECVGLLRRLWPASKLQPDTASAWFDLLAHLPGEQVQTAIQAAHLDGERFMPTAGQLVGRIAELDMDAKPFAEVWALIHSAIRRYGSRSDRTMEWLEEQDPLAALLARMVGLRTIGMSHEGDTTLFAQARDTYQAILRRERRGRTLMGLPAVGLKELERITRPRPVGDVVRGFIEGGGDESAA